MHGVHGTSSFRARQGLYSNGLDRTVTVFEPRTLQFRKLIRYTGVKPDAIQYDRTAAGCSWSTAARVVMWTINRSPATDAIIDTVDLAALSWTNRLRRSRRAVL